MQQIRQQDSQITQSKIIQEQQKIQQFQTTGLQQAVQNTSQRKFGISVDNKQKVIQVGTFFLIFFVLNFAFLVCDLYYAYRKNLCVDVQGLKVQFSLQKWLQVDGYLKLSIISLFLIVIIIALFVEVVANIIEPFAKITILIYSLFQISWLIVGSVLFWNQLNRGGYFKQICGKALHDYMFAVLIIGYIILFANILVVKFAGGFSSTAPAAASN